MTSNFHLSHRWRRRTCRSARRPYGALADAAEVRRRCDEFEDDTFAFDDDDEDEDDEKEDDEEDEDDLEDLDDEEIEEFDDFDEDEER